MKKGRYKRVIVSLNDYEYNQLVATSVFSGQTKSFIIQCLIQENCPEERFRVRMKNSS